MPDGPSGPFGSFAPSACLPLASAAPPDRPRTGGAVVCRGTGGFGRAAGFGAEAQASRWSAFRVPLASRYWAMMYVAMIQN